MKLIDKLVKEFTSINERVSGRDTVWDSDQREVIDLSLIHI